LLIPYVPVSYCITMIVIYLLYCRFLPMRFHSQYSASCRYFYNKNVRPVKNSTQPLEVKFGSSLIRIIDVVSLLDNKYVIYYQQ
jgi:hypothetical protein